MSLALAKGSLIMKARFAIAAAASAALLAGCASNGDMYRSDVYTAGQVNQMQEVRTVEIIAVQAARVAVGNTENRTDARTIGMIMGAIAGAAIGNHNNHSGSARLMGGLAGGALGGIAGQSIGGSRQELVNGVQITFREGNKLYNSAQVGQVCEFKTGTAIMISQSPTETRIQPNNPYGCPKK